MSSWHEVFSEISSCPGKEYLLEAARIAIRMGLLDLPSDEAL